MHTVLSDSVTWGQIVENFEKSQDLQIFCSLRIFVFLKILKTQKLVFRLRRSKSSGYCWFNFQSPVESCERKTPYFPMICASQIKIKLYIVMFLFKVYRVCVIFDIRPGSPLGHHGRFLEALYGSYGIYRLMPIVLNVFQLFEMYLRP